VIGSIGTNAIQAAVNRKKNKSDQSKRSSNNEDIVSQNTTNIRLEMADIRAEANEKISNS
jgi:hypothetical protein